ncbi:MAG: ABC transporter permease [Malacoplasma sp.]
MKQLIKQIFKSLKSSLLLILSLIFISFCIIFVSSSSLFINQNLNNSVNTLRTEGNSADVIIDKKYNSSDITYTHSAPVSKQVRVSNYTYKTTTGPNRLQNVIFPYQASDFTAANINADLGEVPPPDAPPYYDRYLPRYAARKFGMFRGGKEISANINANSINSWSGIGYSMTNHATGEKLFDPKYFVFDDNPIVIQGKSQANLIGYFNEGSILNEITISESQMIPINNNFTYSTNQGIAKFPIIPVHKNSIWHYRIDLNPFLNDYGNYYGDLLTSLRSNTTLATANAYTLEIERKSLKGIDLFVYDEMQKLILAQPTKPNLFIDYKKMINDEFIIRDEWVDEYILDSGGTIPIPPTLPTPEQVEQREEAIKSFLDNRKTQLTNEFKLFVDNNKDAFISDYIKKLGYKNNGDSSFNFYDRESKSNYLITRKEDNLINKIVLNNGAPLVNSSEYQKWYSSIYGKLLSVTGYANLNKKSMTEGILSFVEFYSKVIPTLNLNTTAKPNLTAELGTLANSTLEKLTFNPTDPLLSAMLKKLFSYFSDPTFSINDFQNIKINSNYIGNSSIFNDRSFYAILPILDNYTITTTQKFVDSSNKQILPQSGNDTDNWDYAKTLSSLDFYKWLNNLDSKYTLQIGIDKLVITGTGISPEMAYPAIDLINLIPNPKNDILVYVNDSTYNLIWVNSGKPFKNEYFAIEHDHDLFSIDLLLDKLNKDLMPIMNNSTYKVAHRLNTFTLSSNILAIRYAFPNLLSNTVLISSIVFVLILSLLAMYLFYIVLKKYIDVNKVQLAIIKANGLSTFKMSICFSTIALAIAIISGVIGYLLSYFFQPIIFSIFSPYIFISPIFNPFSAISFFGGIILIFLIATIFVFIILHFLFKKPLNSIMSQNIEVKHNVLLSVLKYKNTKINSNGKFKIALFISNTSRTLFYILGCIAGISLITISLTLTNKFYTSKYLTDINKDYIFNIDLVTPIDQSGLYKTQEYSSLGITNPDIGITSIYEDTKPGVLPYTKNQLPIYEIEEVDLDDNIIKKKQKLDSNGKPMYFGNIALPSLQMYNFILENPDSMRNAVMAKWLLDFDANVPFVGIVNSWNKVKELLPPEIVSKISTQDKEFKDQMLITPGIGKLYKSFLKLDPITNEYVFDDEKVLIRPAKNILNQNFLDFVGLVYGDEKLSALDAKVSWGTMPIDSKTTETYTYVDADISAKKENGKSKVYGINPYSKYMNLKDNNEQFIGHLLDKPENNIIINNGAALKYKLKIGDEINLKVNNSYFRYTEKMMGLESFIPNEFTFKVVGINSTSFGEEFFINQKIANKITYLDKGTFISKIDLKDPNVLAKYKTVSVPYQTDPEKLNYYVPYNGYLCNTDDPIYLSKTLSFYSLINLYGQIGKLSLDNDQTSYLISAVSPDYIVEAFMTKSDWIMEQYNLNQSNPDIANPITRDIYKDNFLKTYNNHQLLMNYMSDYFSQDVMLLSLNNIINYSASQVIYTTLIGTLDTAQILVMSLLIPIIILIIFIMSSIMLNEIRTMLSVLKTLGYSDKQNITNILFTFIPIFIISTLFSLAVLAIFLIGFQSIIYYFLSIYISASIHFLQFFYAVLAIFAILLANILFTIYTYKNSNLNTAITF